MAEPPDGERRGPEAPGAAADEARQRWRLVLRREPAAAPLNQREVSTAFDAALAASGLPLVVSGRARSRVAFAAPLPTGMPAEHELADLVLAERRPVHEVRARLARALPTGYQLVGLHDVWLGEPSIASQVVAADHRVTLQASTPGVRSAVLASAAAELLAASHLPRERTKGAGVVRYDLRPLLVDVVPLTGATPPVLWIRTRFHPQLGTGRPEEVVAALGERLGRPLKVAEIVRERVLLAEDVEAGPRVAGADGATPAHV